MNRLSALKQQLNLTPSSSKLVWVEANIPYNLKDVCKQKFKGQVRWNADLDIWEICECIAYQFEKVFLEEYTNPSKEQRKLLKDSGCNYDSDVKLWYFLKFQTTEDILVDED